MTKLALALLAGCLAAPAIPQAPVSLENTYKAIVLLRCSGGSGTAFSIAPGRFITAEHVTRSAPCTIDGTPVQVVHENVAMDSAEIRGPDVGSYLPFTCRGFKHGKQYQAIGYAGGIHRLNLPLLGLYGRSYDHGAGGLNQFIGDVIPGMSGGPVMDRAGRVVGLVNRHSPARSRSLAETHICKGRRG